MDLHPYRTALRRYGLASIAVHKYPTDDRAIEQEAAARALVELVIAAERERIAAWLTGRSRDLRAEAVAFQDNPDPDRPEAPRVRMAKALALTVAASDLRRRRDVTTA